MSPSQRNTRRSLLCGGAAVGLAYAAGNRLAAAEAEKEEIPVSPTEDLMREHGVVSRILLIYQDCLNRVQDGKELPADAVHNAASIIRSFIQDHHERDEENYIFPRFEKAGKLVELVKVLRTQHDGGRRLTDTIQQIVTKPDRDPEDMRKLTDSLRLFIRMYLPHKARENTVLFPAFHEVITPQEYKQLGETLEQEEDKTIGENGFEKTVDRVAGIEKQLGIYDLAQFTPPG